MVILCLRVKILSVMRHRHVVGVKRTPRWPRSYSVSGAHRPFPLPFHDVFMCHIIFGHLLFAIIEQLIIMVNRAYTDHWGLHLISPVNILLQILVRHSNSSWRLVLVLVVILVRVQMAYPVWLNVLRRLLGMVGDQERLGAARFSWGHSCRSMAACSLLLLGDHFIHLLRILVDVSKSAPTQANFWLWALKRLLPGGFWLTNALWRIWIIYWLVKKLSVSLVEICHFLNLN